MWWRPTMGLKPKILLVQPLGLIYAKHFLPKSNQFTIVNGYSSMALNSLIVLGHSFSKPCGPRLHDPAWVPHKQAEHSFTKMSYWVANIMFSLPLKIYKIVLRLRMLLYQHFVFLLFNSEWEQWLEFI